MKLLVAGSRSVKEFDLSPHIPPDVDLLISGGAKGIDALAEKYADADTIPEWFIIKAGKAQVLGIVVHIPGEEANLAATKPATRAEIKEIKTAHILITTDQPTIYKLNKIATKDNKSVNQIGDPIIIKVTSKALNFLFGLILSLAILLKGISLII